MKKKPTPVDEDALARNVLSWEPRSADTVTYGYGRLLPGGTRTMMATMSQAWVPSTMTTDRAGAVADPVPRVDWVIVESPPDGYEPDRVVAAPRRERKTPADEPVELSTRREIALAQKEKPS